MSTASDPAVQPTASPPREGAGPHARPLRLVDLVLFSITAIVVADTVGAASAIGVQSLTFWLICAVFFFIPYGLITAELGSAWPQEGGIYVWVREAFGQASGAMTAWLYWVNVGLWMPSVFVLFMGTYISVFATDLSRVWEATIVVVLIWLTVAIGVLDLRIGKWIPDITGVLKIVVLLGLGVIGVIYATTEGTANSFALSEWAPSWGDNYAFLPVIVYSFMGFELMSSAGGAIQNPQRSVPKAIAWAGGLSAAVYLLATFGILAAVPLGDVSIVTGIADALAVSFEAVFGTTGIAYDLVIVALLATFFGNMVSWSMGGNRTIAATGLDRAAPGVFGHHHPRFNTPDYAYYLMGAIASVVAVLNYALFADSEDVFWTIFAVSSIVFLLPYLLMFPAALVLRRRHPEVERPFVVPGGRLGLVLAVGLCELFVVLAIVLFFTEVPEGTSSSLYWSITGGGTALSLAVGWWLHKRSTRRARTGQEV